MASAQLPVISVKGTAFECGEQYGQQAQKLIRRNIDHYLERWQKSWGASHQDIMNIAKPFIPVIGNYDSEILEYMQGIAKGSGLSLEEVIALNARYEISYANPVGKVAADGCTAMAAMPEVTKNGHTLLGQNWDFFPNYAGLRIMLEVAQNGKPAFACVSEAGLVAHRGMNTAGVGVCFNALTSNWDHFEPKTPYPVIICAMLKSESIGMAIKAVFNTTTVVSGNILCSHRDGETFDIEVCPKNVATMYASDGIMTHTNHFIDYTERQGMIDQMRLIIPDTLIRYHRSRKLLEMKQGSITVETFQEIFRDHVNYPNGICRHVDSRDSELDQAVTLSSFLMDMNEGIFYICENTPCNNDYYKYAPKVLTGIPKEIKA